MARFIQLIHPILQFPLPVSFAFGRSVAGWFSHFLAWLLVVVSFYYSVKSHSTLLIGQATLQLAFGLLILLEAALFKIKAGPVESRRLEMTAYCLGGVFILLLCIYQFSEAYAMLHTTSTYWNRGVLLAVTGSLTGNILLLRLLWQSGLIRSRIRAICRPMVGILLLNILCIFSSLIIHLTHYVQLDALIGLISGIVLFLLTTGMMIDAYWHLIEVEMKGMGK